LAYLRNDEVDFELELTLNKGRSEPYAHADGYGHLAVCVDDCRAERQRFAEFGVEPTEVKEFARNGALMARFVFCRGSRWLQNRDPRTPRTIRLKG
jgi:lactoylglutathione lyase